jgi:hypothetical protein
MCIERSVCVCVGGWGGGGGGGGGGGEHTSIDYTTNLISAPFCFVLILIEFAPLLGSDK